jgi:hypothetical protein
MACIPTFRVSRRATTKKTTRKNKSRAKRLKSLFGSSVSGTEGVSEAMELDNEANEAMETTTVDDDSETFTIEDLHTVTTNGVQSSKL